MRKRLLVTFITLFILTAFASFIFSGKVNAFSFWKKDKPFTIAWFTDTQYYSANHPEIFDFMCDWFVQEHLHGNLNYIIHTGDIVNKKTKTNEWETASNSLRKLDQAKVPYGLLAGNHDVAFQAIDYSLFHKYFGSWRYKDKPWFGDSMENNRNHYDLITLGKHNFIILYLGYDTIISKGTVQWSNQVLKKYSQRNAILALHEYLDYDGTVLETTKHITEQIVKTNDNIVMVLCGHNQCAKRNLRKYIDPKGRERTVLEMICDYQDAPRGGDGFMRYLHFYPSEGIITVVTYSPYTNSYNYFDESEDSFSEKIELK